MKNKTKKEYIEQNAAPSKKTERQIFKRYILPAICAVVLTGVGFLGGFITSRATLDKDIEKIDFILQNYRKYYYDEQSDVVGIFADALLDEYSDYYTQEEYAAILSSDKGSSEGIGAVFEQRSDGVFVFDVLGNSPAQKAGLNEGERVYAVKTGQMQKPQTVTDLNWFIDSVKSANAYEDITLYLVSGDNERTITLQKQAYTQTFVKYYDESGEYGFSDVSGKMKFLRTGDNKKYPLDNADTAVISYYAFSGTEGGLNGSVGQMLAALEKFKSDGKRNIIIDLRGNGGGFLNIMQEVSAHFVAGKNGEKPIVVTVRDKYGNEQNYRSGNIKYNDYGFKNVVFLADGNTASASEALIGAALDYDNSGVVKVVVSGGKTYGKGIMQTTFTRISGDAIKLTTAKLFWPQSNRCIHVSGITQETDERVYAESSVGSAFYDGLEFCK